MESTLILPLLEALCEQRWMLPLMARMQGRAGARFAELHRALDAPRESMTRTLQAAVDAGWLVRNSGYGHPLRSEYLLTREGEAAAALASVLDQRLAQAGLTTRDLTRWSLPALYAIEGGSDRFNAIARDIAAATPRGLSQSLKALVANDLVQREVTETFPPASRYCLTPRGQALTDQRTIAL